ncbi:MAG TPA: alpha/beta hydrolase domain-containing protein [Xanthobacteraceae bacterium]|nr:alpha/beta hydrolase domain-containing protein [Xanthobacteraceae bacterium]
MFRRGALAALIALAACVVHGARAEVSRIEITSRTAVLDGKAFGSAGAYEKITGKVFFAIDPSHPRNKAIVDLDKAPRDSAGRVTFSADLYVLAPKDATRGNGAALFDILNRGRKNIFRDFNRAKQGSNDPTTEAELGDGFLMQQGYTLVWLGWQFDIPHRGGLMGLDAPPVSENGKSPTGRVSTTFTPNTADPTYPLDDLGRYADTTAYPPVDATSTANQLTVRDGLTGAPQIVPRDRWQFARLKNGQVVPDISAIYLKDGFQPGHVYELSYEAKGAVVAGVGFAALRDMASAVKHGRADPIAARYAYAFGPSQDGRLLREFIYEGFNADEQGERAFDGVMSQIAGSARGSDFNSRFARPNGAAFFVASLFPFLDLDQKDPITGKTDGLQAHLEPSQRPKILYTNTPGEYWGAGRAAALIHMTLDGRDDAEVPDNVRIYLIAGTQHVPGGYLASQGEGQQKPNPNEYSWALRALLVDMDHWVRDGSEPPPSAYPRLSLKTLVPRDELKFPEIPGVHSPLTIPAGYRADLGGPPSSHPLPLLVPAVDPDGNELAGIRLPNIAVPLATYTGWNFRSPSIGQPDELLPLTGSFIPFAVTKAARDQAHDPRRSIEERYKDRAAYRELVTSAATKLADDRYVLRDDVPAIVDVALATWDQLTRGTAAR